MILHGEKVCKKTCPTQSPLNRHEPTTFRLQIQHTRQQTALSLTTLLSSKSVLLLVPYPPAPLRNGAEALPRDFPAAEPNCPHPLALHGTSVLPLLEEATPLPPGPHPGTPQPTKQGIIVHYPHQY